MDNKIPDNNSDNNSDNNLELKSININKIRKEAHDICKMINKKNIYVNKIKNEFNTFYLAYPILFNNLVDKKMSIEEFDILLNTLETAQDHFFKSI